MRVYPLQGASSPSFASGCTESEPQRDHFSIFCPSGAQQLCLHVPKEGFHCGTPCQRSLASAL